MPTVATRAAPSRGAAISSGHWAASNLTLRVSAPAGRTSRPETCRQVRGVHVRQRWPRPPLSLTTPLELLHDKTFEVERRRRRPQPRALLFVTNAITALLWAVTRTPTEAVRLAQPPDPELPRHEPYPDAREPPPGIRNAQPDTRLPAPDARHLLRTARSCPRLTTDVTFSVQTRWQHAHTWA